MAALALASAAHGAAARAPADEPEVMRVTATRTELPVHEIPAAATILTRDDIQRGRTLLGLDEALNIVPGVFIQNRHNFAQDERISIRGFGARASFGIRGVAVIVDGIPATLPDGQSQVDSIDLGSAERIEVLRGPASALYGNAAGGVISVTSESGSRPPELSVRQTLGDHGLTRTQVQGGGRWERGDVMFSANRLDFDGFRDHSAVEQRQLNGKLRWRPADDTELTTVVSLFDSPVAEDAGGVTIEEAQEDPDGARDRNVAFDAGEEVEQRKVGLRLEQALGEDDRQHLSLGGFYVGRDFSNKLPFEDGGQVAFDRQFFGLDGRYELRGEILGLSHHLTVGLDYRLQEDDRQRFDNLRGSRGALVLDQIEEIRSRAAYLRHRVQLSERWALTAAVRWDEVELDVGDRFLGDGNDSGQRDWDELSPNAGLLWRPRDDLTLYANVGTAFQTPTTTELANPEDPGRGGGFNPNLEPQTARNFEVGLRGELRGRLHYEASAFRTRIDDAITTFEVPGFSGTGRDFFRNAGESTRQGLELALAAELLEGLSARASYAYIDAEFDDFSTPDGLFDGNRLPGVPKHQMDARLAYETPRELFVEAEVHHVGDFYADNANTAENRGYTLLDVRAGRRWSLAAWRVNGFVGMNNVTDERYNENVRVNAFGGRFFEPGPDRHVYGGLELTRVLAP